MKSGLEDVEMTNPTAEESQIRYAGFPGFMYLFVNVAYLSGQFITTRLEVPGNFAQTAHRIMGAELLYRIGLCSEFNRRCVYCVFGYGSLCSRQTDRQQSGTACFGI